MKPLMTMVCRLSPIQRQTLPASLTSGVAHCEALELVQSRLRQAPSCPKCRGAEVVRNGQADGLQRYKCRGCGVSFNALTGTPLARLRHRDRWMQQSQALGQGLSVRMAAARMGVHRTTSFRRRHRFLTLPRDVREWALSGVAEADENYVLRHTTDGVLELVDKASISQVLRIAVAPDAVLCTDGSNILAAVAKALSLEHQPVDVQSGQRVRGAWHIQNVNAHHGRFKEWMRRFKGVATSYLPNYLGWFRALDRNAQSGAKPASLLAWAVGA